VARNQAGKFAPPNLGDRDIDDGLRLGDDARRALGAACRVV
jgi:hypothetical protein